MQAAVTADKGKYIEEKMKKFRLVDMREQYSDIIAEAENEKMDYADFLIRLLAVEDAGKTLRRTEMLVEKAGFDTASDLDDIDYGFNHSLDKDKIEYLGQLHFMDGHAVQLAPVVKEYRKNNSSPSRLDKPYSEVPNRPAKVA